MASNRQVATTMPVPFLDLRAPYRELRDEIDDAIQRVLEGGWYVLGTEVERFEAEFARYVGARHCIGVGNGLEALHLSLRAMDVGVGDQVIVPSNTYIASWLAVTQAGAEPVPVEPDQRSYNLDPRRVYEAIGPRTRAIMPVHLYGRSADMEPLLEVARSHGLLVLDDAAQAHGASYHGKRVGALANATAWSFYPSKNLGAVGDGGAVTTNDNVLAEKLRALRNYGSRVKYFNEVPGYNSRLDEVQAAVLRVKLRHLDEWNQRRRDIAARYLEQLNESRVVLPHAPEGSEPAWHLFVIRTPHRQELQHHLSSRGVQTLVHYPVPPHLQKAYASLDLRPGSFPISEAIHREVLSLPIGPHMTDSQVDCVVDSILQFDSQ